MRSRHGFSIVEALVALAIAATALVLVISQTGMNFRFFAQSDDTLASARAVQLLLSYLKADVAMADSPPHTDITQSPGTGSVFPKNWMHAAHEPGSGELKLFTHTVRETAQALSTADPIAAKPATDPLTRLALQRAARVQNALAWVDAGGPPTDQRVRHFVLTIRSAAIVQRVTYSYIPPEKVVVRQGPDGTTRIGAGLITDFSASPYLEFLVPRETEKPLELLKCWVEVQIDARADQKTDPLAKRGISVHTRLVPRYLTSVVRGLSPF